VEVNNVLHVSKARNAPGHGMSLGFKVDWPKLEFVEHGIIIRE
jgi:hypothetical protein